MDIVLLLVVLRRVEGLVREDVLLRRSEVTPDVLCSSATAVTGVVVCVRWGDVAFVTSEIRRHRGSRLWKEKRQ